VEPYYPEGLKWQDGSLEFDLPMNRLSELFNVNHFIVSQVNPHVIPFATIGNSFFFLFLFLFLFLSFLFVLLFLFSFFLIRIFLLTSFLIYQSLR